MKHFYRLSLIGLFLIISFFASSQAIFQSNASGNWSAPGTWAYVSGADLGTVGIPDAGDNAIIRNANIVNMNITTLTINDLTLNNTSSIDFNTNPGTLNVTGNIQMTGSTSIIRSGGGGGNTRNLNLTGNFTVTASSTAQMGGLNFTQNSASTFTINGTFQPTATNGNKILGRVIMNNGSLWDAAVNEAYTTNNFTIFDGAEINAAGVNATINIGGNLLVQSSVTGLHSKIGRVNITVTGTTTVSGYWEFSQSNSGTKTFNSTITVNPGGTWDNIVGEDPRINCSIVNNGLWPVPTGGNGRYDVLVGGNYTYSGNSTMGMTRLNITAATAVVTNQAPLRVTRTGNQGLSVVNGATFINGSGGYLYLTSSAIPVDVDGISIVNFSAANNTVEYDFAGAQTIHGTTYDQIVCSNSGTKTINSDVIVNTSLTITGSVIVDQNSGFGLTGNANLIMTGTTKFRTAQSGTVPSLVGTAHNLGAGTIIEFYRNGAQTAAASNPAAGGYPYKMVQVTQASVINLGLVTNIAEDLTFRNTASISSAAPVLNLTIGGEWDHGSTGASSFFAGSAITSSTFIQTSGTITASNLTQTINGNNGAFNHDGGTYNAGATGTLIFVTGNGQEIKGSAATTLANIVMANTNSITLLKNVTYSLLATFNAGSGNIVTQTSLLICTPTGTGVNRLAANSGFVEGNFQKALAAGSITRVFEVGTGTTYAPVTMIFVGNSVGSFTVSSTALDHPDVFSSLINPSRSANRYWTLKNNAVTFTSVNVTFQYVNADLDNIADATASIVKNLNSSTLVWTKPTQGTLSAGPPPTAQVTGLTTVASELPNGIAVDFQIGLEIDPTEVINRITGVGLSWINPATWVQTRTGTSSLLAQPTDNVVGTGTKFNTELAVNDIVYFSTNTIPGLATAYTVTAIASDVLLTVTPQPPATGATPYGRQYVPVNSIDAVIIGNAVLADATTTINYDRGSMTNIFSLDIGQGRTQRHQLTHTVATKLKMDGYAIVYQNTNDNTGNPHSWNINGGDAEVLGNTIMGGTVLGGVTPINDPDRIARININGGTLTANSISFRTAGGGAANQVAVLDASGGDGLINISGSFNFATGTKGTFTPKTTGTGSTVNFNGTNAQTLSYPTGTPTTFVYHNIRCNNSNVNGLSVVNDLAPASGNNRMSGDLSVQTGLLRIPGNNTITGGATKTFNISSGAVAGTFRMEGNQGFPTGFATYNLGTTGPSFGTVEFRNSGGSPFTIANLPGVDTYGNLNFKPSANIAYDLPNTTINVANQLTVGNGTDIATVRGTTATILAVVGDIFIDAASVLNATNISQTNVGGNWINNGSFTESTNTVSFNNLSSNVLRTIGGATPETFYNLTINTNALTDAVRLLNNTTVTNNLVLTKGELNLNGTTLAITNSATSAIDRTGANVGYIKGEKTTAPYGEVKWQQELAPAASVFVYPFGKSSTEYIPFTYTVTTAATGGSSPRTISVSTYGTATDNLPIMSPATNLNGTTGGVSVVDRYWAITLNNYIGTRPTATMDFVATDAEITTTGLNPETPTTYSGVTSAVLAAQRWSPSNYWDAAVGSPSQTYTPDTPAPTTNTGRVQILGWNQFTPGVASPWVLVDQSVPLPIELVEFTAVAKLGIVELNWRTASELNNDLFTIERSTSGEKFYKIDSISGAGTKSSESKYLAKDLNPNPGLSYYRLKQTDFDGKFTYSKVISVEIAAQNLWSVYPNPSNGDILNIRLTNQEINKEAYIGVHDVSGKQLFSQTSKVGTSGLITVEPFQKLTSGMYVITVAVEQRMVKQKLMVR